mgnify:CR=1 FL=1
MKIVVTGGAGFLGYHIAQRIHEIADYRDTVFFDIAPFEEGEYNKEIICKFHINFIVKRNIKKNERNREIIIIIIIEDENENINIEIIINDNEK